VEQFKWNYILEKEEDDDTDADGEDNEAAIDKDYDNDSYTDDDDDNVSSTKMSNRSGSTTLSGDDNTPKSGTANLYPHLSQALGGGKKVSISFKFFSSSEVDRPQNDQIPLPLLSPMVSSPLISLLCSTLVYLVGCCVSLLIGGCLTS
jgi:hypothetical protein